MTIKPAIQFLPRNFNHKAVYTDNACKGLVLRSNLHKQEDTSNETNLLLLGLSEHKLFAIDNISIIGLPNHSTKTETRYSAQGQTGRQVGNTNMCVQNGNQQFTEVLSITNIQLARKTLKTAWKQIYQLTNLLTFSYFLQWLQQKARSIVECHCFHTHTNTTRNH